MPQPESHTEKFDQVLGARAQEGNWLKSYAAKGLEQQLRTLHGRYQQGELSFGHLAEELGLNVWELTHLLEELELSTTNLPNRD